MRVHKFFSFGCYFSSRSLMPLREDIIQVLTDSQSSLHNHQKLLKKLKALYDQCQDAESFFETFFVPFTNALVVYKREPVVERVIDFVAKFAVATAPSKKQDSDTEKEEEGDVEEESSEDEDIGFTFFSLLLDKLLSIHQARDKAVRFRVCQLVGKLMNYAADAQTSIGPNRLDKVEEVMMQRLYDKIPVVRAHAVSALEFLQDPSPQCPITTALLELMEKDSSPEVRRMILNKIAVSNRTLSAVMERTRDIKEVIRREAFLWLANKCSIRHLTIEERIQLLSDGLNDHSELVQEACVNGLLRNWSLESLNGDFITLLSRLDVESSPQVVELALTKLFDNFSLEELTTSMVSLIVSVNTKPEVWGESPDRTPKQRPAITPSKSVYDGGHGDGDHGDDDSFVSAKDSPEVKLIPLDLLKCEEAFYWRCLCHYLHSKGDKGDELLESIVPTLTEMCDYIERYVREVLLLQDDMESSLQCQFVTQQLCSMLVVMDSSDEVGRRRIAKLVCDLLVISRLPAGLVEHLLAQQTKIWPQETFRIEKLTEVIAELRHPSCLSQPTSNPIAESTQDLPPGSISTLTSAASSDETSSGQSLATTILPFEGGEDSQMSYNVSILELRDDADTLYKCLCIACEMFKELKFRKLSPTLQTLVDTLLLPCIGNENPYVRDMALLCLGLSCLIDIHMARGHLLLFLQVSQVDHETVQATALKVVFDLLHVYGFEAFNIGAPGEPNSAVKTSTGDEQGEKEDAEIPDEVAITGETETEGGEGDGEEAGEQLSRDSEKRDEITQRILNIMANFLEGESSLLREVAAQGIAKLLLCGRILSQKLLAKLVVLWYNPLTQDEAKLRNTLGTFFPAFAASDRRHRECLSEVYLPVMKMVLEAPPTSPLTEIDVGNMADFIIQLTRPTSPSEDSVHDSMAVAVANEILSDPDTTDIRVYCRSLSAMELTSTNESNAADLLVLWEKMNEEVRDRTSRRHLEKFGAILKKIKPDYTSPEAPAASVSNEDDSTPPQPTSTSDDVSKQDGNGDPNQPTSPATATETVGVAKEVEPAASAKPKARTRATTQGGTKAKAKTTTKKQAVKSARKGQKRSTVQSKPRRRGVRFCEDTSSEDSDENFDPCEIADLPKRSASTRLSKSVASQRLAKDDVRAALAYSEESDDSLIGDHSPFVKSTRSRRTTTANPLAPLQYNEEVN